MLRNIDPPLGFGKKCPERLAYKKLIRMNMPMDFEGKVRKLFVLLYTIHTDGFSSNHILTKCNEVEHTKLWNQ